MALKLSESLEKAMRPVENLGEGPEHMDTLGIVLCFTENLERQ